ncbi:tail assembly protein [Rouxiella badensis]|uniref:tail assembly protein n=1 Tax=Rouxiella badensis TaxID=1646377 RepID=UPI0028D85E73|nr:tail assembly protein [Rouxiella badensis]
MSEATEVMTTIKLYGQLGNLFGKEHQRLVRTTKEAMRALCCTLKGFENYMKSSRFRGLTYAVYVNKNNIGEDDLEYPNVGREIRIVPVIIGSKRAGALQTILGAVLVVVGAIGAFTPIGQAFGGAAWGPYMMQAGGALLAGGIIQMISPQASGLSSKQDADNQASYAFGGVTNTAAQGYPVPLAYGKRRIGGAIISAGIYVEDQQ